MLKNYTVIVKNVNINKRQFLLNYLNDNFHKNHKDKKTEIFELSERESFENITKEKLELNEKNYKANKKGGKKLKRIGKSLTFNLPKDYQKIASVENCKKIDKLLKKEILKIYGRFGIEIEENEIYSVLHYQDNPHIHMILPYLDRKGQTIRQINPKGFTSRLKVLFSQIVDHTLGTKIEEYEKLSNLKNGENKISMALKEIKLWYETLLKIDKVDTKYYLNQIKSIDRRLKDKDNLTDRDLEQATKNMKKAESQRIKNKLKTPSTPFF